MLIETICCYRKLDLDTYDLHEALKETEEYEAAREQSISADPDTPLLPNTVKKRKKTELSGMKPIPTFVEQKWPIYDRRQLKFDLETMMFLVTTGQPFTLVDEPGFKRYISGLQHRARIKHSTTFSRFKLPILHDAVKTLIDSQVDKELMDVTCAAVTTDLWTSRVNDAYMSLTLHYINANFESKHIVVSCEPFTGAHTGTAIADKLDQLILSMPGYHFLNTIYAVHDAASNMKNAVAKCNTVFESFLCIDHQLNLVLQFAEQHDDCTGVHQACEEFQKLTSHLHKSVQSLEAVQNRAKELKGNSPF